jgi:hypothetical protein
VARSQWAMTIVAVAQFMVERRHNHNMRHSDHSGRRQRQWAAVAQLAAQLQGDPGKAGRNAYPQRGGNMWKRQFRTSPGGARQFKMCKLVTNIKVMKWKWKWKWKSENENEKVKMKVNMSNKKTAPSLAVWSPGSSVGTGTIQCPWGWSVFLPCHRCGSKGHEVTSWERGGLWTCPEEVKMKVKMSENENENETEKID